MSFRAGRRSLDTAAPRGSRTLPTPYDTDNGSGGFDALVVEPGRNGDRIEPEQVSPLDERDASFGDESADVADADGEVGGERVDVDEVRERRRCRGLALHA